LLTAAQILKQNQEALSCTVLLVFQSGEEQDPGGARLLLAHPIFQQYKPVLAIAQHATPDLPVGTVAFGEGTVMASADEVHITVLGQGGHGAVPHQLNDTVLAAAQTIVALQQVVSRRSNPFSPCVLSFGKFIAAGATNIIPSEVTLAGSLRCMDEQERMRLKTAIASIVQYTIEAFGCQYSMTLNDGYPCVFNQPTSTRLLRSYAEEYLSARQVAEMPPKMTAEDFGFFSQRYPSVYFRFGTAGELPSGRQHSSTFLIDEQALRTASAMPAYLALRWGKQ
jgi:hippurate hydrolase